MKKKTGTDLSLAECCASGYGIVTHYGDRIFPNRQYLFEIGKEWFRVSYKELYDKAVKDEGFKSYTDWKNCPYPDYEKETIRPWDLASLAQGLYYFCGLE